MRTDPLPKPTTRLLTQQEASAYCGMSLPTFKRMCGVRPLVFGEGKRALYRYDKSALDIWIDGLATPESRGVLSADEALERMQRHHELPRRRHPAV
jgi:hypothetical protein